MKRIFIGHRGVGKTSLLARHQNYFPNIPHFDLDAEIEKTTGQKIFTIFKSNGELLFRDLERSIFENLTGTNSQYCISVGAGFDLKKLVADAEIIFVSRVTDSGGRLFLNRPRLDDSVDALTESLQKYQIRQKQYEEAAQSIYYMPEGIEAANNLEEQIFSELARVTDAIYTLTVNDLSNLEHLKKRFKNIELRSDLIPPYKIEHLVAADESFAWLVSIRTADAVAVNAKLDVDHQFLNNHLAGQIEIISCHEDNVDQALDIVSRIDKRVHLKISPIVDNFEDLLKGFKWQQADSVYRSFLPRSKNGKWLWYRQLSKYWQKLNFVRNFTDLADQPSLYQWLSLPKVRPAKFAAVVGKPVLFSRSPEFHREFFSSMNTFMSAIELENLELMTYWQWLAELGLTYVAVTSPLKKSAYEIASSKSDLVIEFQSANTLLITDSVIFSENTDHAGFSELVRSIVNKSSVVVWGGGGTLDMMKSILPQGNFFSTRSKPPDDKLDPDTVIWAAPRRAEAQWPFTSWNPIKVIDLNYAENSMGLEYAQRLNCSYESGLVMFKAQALAQQKYWSKL